MSCRMRLGGDNGGPGIPRATHLPVQRPAGAGHQEAQARRGGMGCLPPKLGRQRAPLPPSNAHKDTPLETLAYVGGSRRRIETEFDMEKGDVGLDEYETRSWAGWHHHIAMCRLSGAFLLRLQQDWEQKDAPGSPVCRCTGWYVRCCPGSGSGAMSCCNCYRRRSCATSGPVALTPNAEPLSGHTPTPHFEPSL